MRFNFTSEPSRAQTSKHSKQRIHSASAKLDGTSSMPIEHSMSQRPHWLQVELLTNFTGEILLKIVSVAPSGQRYLHQARSIKTEVTRKVMSTLHKSGVILKLKTARTGQKSCRGG